MSVLSELEFKLLCKNDQDGGEPGDKDWGVFVVDRKSLPETFKSLMMDTVLAVEKVKSLTTEVQDSSFFHNIFINRMCATNQAFQQRQDNTP
jgi:hypothetical protein